MTYIELLIIAISLSADTFAVSAVGGMSLKNISKFKEAQIIASFAFFQATLLLLGLFIGETVINYIGEWDHWIAFFILLYLGGKMVISSFSKSDDDKSINLLNQKTLVLMSIATSIDAIAVGFSLSVFPFPLPKILFTYAVTFIVTALASILGIAGGLAFSKIIGKKAELFGGIILIIIGIRILVEHIFFS